LKELGGHFERGLIAQLALGHYKLKLLAITASIALYVAVHQTQDAERVVDYDVLAVVPSTNERRVLVSTVPGKLRVTLRGPKSAVNAVQPAKLKPIPVDLRSYSGSTFSFDKRLVAVPSRVQVVQIEPAFVRLAWRPRAERGIPVRVQLLGTAPSRPAHVVSIVGPTTVGISGPADETQAPADIVTDQVSVAGLQEGVHELAATRAPLPGHLVYSSASPVRVRVQVDPAR